MSVDNVQSKFLTMAEFSNLTEAEQARYNSASKAERKQMTIEFRQSKETPPEEPVTGMVVEPGKEDVATPEEKKTRAERREERRQRELEAIARQKEYAEKLYKPDELTDFEREQIESVIGEDGKPLYRNRKARKELREAFEDNTKAAYKESQAYKDAIANAETDKERKQIEKLYEQMARRGARIRVKDLKIGDRVEHTRVFDSAEEKREARKALGDEADGLRLKIHNKKFIGDDNVNLHAAVEAGQSSHEAAYEMSKEISGDRTYEPNEAENFAAKSSAVQSHDAAARKELRRLGYDVKDDTLKNIGKGLAVGVLSQVGTAALPATINAFAEAMVQNSVTGDRLAFDVDSANEKYFNWKGMGIGAAVGTAVAAAMFGKTEDEDVLHGVGVQEIFMDAPNGERAYENMSFGSKNDTLRVKTLMRAIDELDLTDEQKTQFLIEAAGEDGQRILSKKELAIAYVKAYESKLPDPPVEVEEPVVPEPPQKPEFKSEVVGATKETPVEVPTEYGLRHVSGLYADTIVRKGYVLEDGTPINNESYIKEIRDGIQKRNRVNELGKVPSKWMLQSEITLADGTKVKLRSEDELLKISPEISAASNIGLRNNMDEKVMTKTVIRTENGYKYEISRKDPDAEEFEVISTSEEFFTSAAAAQEAADTELAELEQQAEAEAQEQQLEEDAE